MAVANAGDGERAPELDGDAQTLRQVLLSDQTDGPPISSPDSANPTSSSRLHNGQPTERPCANCRSTFGTSAGSARTSCMIPRSSPRSAVLDDIDERRMTRHGVWDLLTGDDCPIRFEWLDVNDIGNGEQIILQYQDERPSASN